MIDVDKYLHATILVRDLERTRKFYKTVLGLKEIERPRFKFSGTWFAIGDQELHIVVKEDLSGDPAFSDDRHIALGVRDFDNVADKLFVSRDPLSPWQQPGTPPDFFPRSRW